MRKCKSGCGGKMKLMKAGGSTSVRGKITTPLYDNNPRTQGRILKTGGSTDKVTAVKPGCPPGTVRLENGGCGQRETPFKVGGATKNAKLAAMAPPTNKITRADIITAAKKNARKKKK